MIANLLKFKCNKVQLSIDISNKLNFIASILTNIALRYHQDCHAYYLILHFNSKIFKYCNAYIYAKNKHSS